MMSCLEALADAAIAYRSPPQVQSLAAVEGAVPEQPAANLPAALPSKKNVSLENLPLSPTVNPKLLRYSLSST